MSSSNGVNVAMSKKRSNVWHHFTIESNSTAKCNYCSEKKSFNGGSTGNLLRHIKTKHPTVPLQRNIQVKKGKFSDHEKNHGSLIIWVT